MDNQSLDFNSIVIKSILACNAFGIKSVKNLDAILSTDYSIEKYSEIKQLIINGEKKSLYLFNYFNDYSSDLREYLDVMAFDDDNDNKYIVTVYDNDSLQQDPQIIEIFKT